MTAHELDTPDGLNLAERIRRLANGRTTIDVAQFQFIGINEIRQRYGVRWDETRERVQSVSRHFISRRIAPEDVLISGADGFLVVFGSRTGVLAEATAHRISQELNTFFVGAPDIGNDFRIEAAHRSMSVDDFAEAFGELIAESRHSHAVRPRSAPGQIPMGFTPVWDARRGALTTFFITPLDAETGYPLDWDHTHYRHTEMDEMKLKASEETLRELFSRGKRALVGVALHVSSLNSQASLSRLFTTMATFDKQLARYRVVRITGVEPGFPRIYLEDIMRNIRSRIPNIAIGLNWTEPDVPSVLKLQPSAVGFTLPPGALASQASRTDIFARIHAAVEPAKHLAIPIGVEGDILPDQAQRFAADGVQHMASWRIWPIRPDLPAAELWPASRLNQAANCDSAA